MNATSLSERAGRVRVAPRTLTSSEVRAKQRVVGRVKSRIVEATMWFVVTFALAYGAFSMVGNVLAEGQRAQVKSLSASLKVARENDQKAKIEMVAETSLASIDTWAKRRGFVAPAAASEQKVNVVAQETEYVARR